MNTVIKEFRWQAAFRRSIRNQRPTYSQYHHYLTTRRLVSTSNSFTLSQEVTKKFDCQSRSLRPCFNWSSASSKHFSLSSSVSSSSTIVDNEEDGLGIETAEVDDIVFDNTIDADTEDDLAHLRIKLYPLEDNEDGRLERLYEAGSVQQVFDIIEEKNEVNIKLASQALVTIWDVQKLLFKISANFDAERDYFDRPAFIEKISKHPTFLEKIVQPVVDNCESLEDEPLLASLFCLTRMNYNIRGPECERFIDESLRRKETLSLPSISRLCVCLRSESLYGNLLVANFYPLLSKYIDSMSTDLEVRLVAISLRNTHKIISSQMIDSLRRKLSQLKDDIPNWETVTLCKVFLLLLSCRNLGSECKEVYDILGRALIPRVPHMEFMDLLSMQKFLELGLLQPYGLTEVMVQRIMRIVQEDVSSAIPRLDMLANVMPHLNSRQQRNQVADILKKYLTNHRFELADECLLTLLRYTRTKDLTIYNQFWTAAADIVSNKEHENALDRRVLKLGRSYLTFCGVLGFSYRNRDFEFVVKRYFYKLLNNYIEQRQPSIIHPADFARVFSFLLGLATLNDPIFYDIELEKLLDDFSPQFRPADLSAIAKGIDLLTSNLFQTRRPAPKYYDRVLEVCSILEEQCTRVLLDSSHQYNFVDMMGIYRVSLTTRKVKGDSPIVDQAMQRILKCEIQDARSFRELAAGLLSGFNNYPEAGQLTSNFILQSRNQGISPNAAEKFIALAFSMGWEINNGLANSLQLCSERIEKDWEKLSFVSLFQALLGLCFYRLMSRELVQNIFSVEFLDKIDIELASSYNANQYPLRLRQGMMELNRAVCIDMPDMNLPWFHEKFCEEMLSLTSSQETYLHQEVHTVLSSIVGDRAAVQSNVCSPYYYKIDFLVEFDEKNRPIKKHPHQPPGFFKRFQQNDLQIKRKVAILIFTPSAFTRNHRDLRGQFKLRRRHLEILGYDVVEVDPVYWNSMFMSENVMRHSFLESKLYARSG